MTTTHTEVEAVQSVVVRIAHHIDGKKWAELRSLYASEVETDYTSLSGEPKKRGSADDLVRGWQSSLGPVKTQHLLGPIDVIFQAEAALAECHVRAIHRRKGLAGGDEWVVIGHYVIGLIRSGERWLIASMKLETIDQSGNTKLLEQAKL